VQLRSVLHAQPAEPSLSAHSCDEVGSIDGQARGGADDPSLTVCNLDSSERKCARNRCPRTLPSR
jgi:hypothetical protein